jgi:hypothetical protein
VCVYIYVYRSWFRLEWEFIVKSREAKKDNKTTNQYTVSRQRQTWIPADMTVKVSTCALVESLEGNGSELSAVWCWQVKLQRIKMLERVQEEVRHTAIA